MGSLNYKHSENKSFGLQNFSSADIREIGPQVKLFLQEDVFLKQFFYPKDTNLHNQRFVKLSGKLTWDKTQSSKIFQHQRQILTSLKNMHFTSGKSFTCSNGDDCSINDFVLAKDDKGTTVIARILEILQLSGSSEEQQNTPNYLLISIFLTGPTSMTYGMPTLIHQEKYLLVKYNV